MYIPNNCFLDDSSNFCLSTYDGNLDLKINWKQNLFEKIWNVDSSKENFRHFILK